ncbi:MAG: hydroxymethylglutaryl-CoA lyase [Thermodesulfobacteriota bacterium]
MLAALPRKVKIVDVSLRDGLQNVSGPVISTADKKKFFDLLLAAGLTDFEVTSFVSPGRIPQLGDAEAFYSLIAAHEDRGMRLAALVPNEKQLARAIQCQVKTIALFTSPSDTFNRKNINRDVASSLKDIETVARAAAAHGMNIRGLISMVFGCPDEGKIDESLLMKIIERFLSLNAYEVVLSDTVGVAGPGQVHELTGKVKERFGLDKIVLHCHDTRGIAVANVLAALDAGISIFDASTGGLGGCPFARGARGNVATEDLVYLFNTLGIDCGVDLEALEKAAELILSKTGNQCQAE